RRSRALAAVAAVLIATVGVSAAYVASRPAPAYGLDGMRERLQALHSLYLKGVLYQRETTDFGVGTVPFPFERFYERPGRYYADSYGFSSHGNDDLVKVTKLSLAYDGDRVIAVQHEEKRVLTGVNNDPLQTELMVETGLQISEIEQMIGGLPGDFQRVGTEKTGEVWCDVYEQVLHDDPLQFTKRIWIDPTTGLPTRVLVTTQSPGREPERLFEYTEIRANAAPPERLFALQVPDGYELVEPTTAAATALPDDHAATDQPTNPPIGSFSSGSAGASTVSQWVGINIDDAAVLTCWSQWSVVDGEKQWFLDEPQIELNGVAKRPCREQPLWETTSGDVRWRWSLIRPVDGRPLDGAELSFNLDDVDGGSMRLTIHPLAFPEPRLAEIVEAVQRRSLTDAASAGQVLSLQQLRQKLAE
ncbi:MAG: hypothetical protein KDA44_15245, partial [Planctomycetales bacterium]|nr:hypothetical protein [Planctomycetales bacterium]